MKNSVERIYCRLSQSMSQLLLTYYGDDFTGSTDALEVLTAAGVRCVLFTSPPTPAMLAEYPDIQAVGIAGLSRSLSPAAMEAELGPAFASLRALRPRHLHYKVCSTFDSSPDVGSIGKVIEIGSEHNSRPCVPLVVGNPALGRYCVFGNLFAQESVAHEGTVYRLDRHPSASQHPITPMQESDLRRHLAQQTNRRIALFDVLNFSLSDVARRSVLAELVASGTDAVLFDVLYREHLAPLGSLLDTLATGAETLFSVGSSGVEAALVAHWQEMGQLAAVNSWSTPSPADQVLVVSGSCSPVTAGQIDWAVNHGFAEIALETCVLTDEDCDTYLLQTARELVNLINSGRSVIVHTCRGRYDRRLVSTVERLAGRNISSLESSSSESKASCSRPLGTALGRLLGMAVERSAVRRVCIAGGDSASYATREVGIQTLEMICPTVPGAPLCKARAPGLPIDGVEICFKGGQVGREDYFGSLL
jgi:3-oxoisoapionate kinase